MWHSAFSITRLTMRTRWLMKRSWLTVMLRSVDTKPQRWASGPSFSLSFFLYVFFGGCVCYIVKSSNFMTSVPNGFVYGWQVGAFTLSHRICRCFYSSTATIEKRGRWKRREKRLCQGNRAFSTPADLAVPLFRCSTGAPFINVKDSCVRTRFVCSPRSNPYGHYAHIDRYGSYMNVPWRIQLCVSKMLSISTPFREPKSVVYSQLYMKPRGLHRWRLERRKQENRVPRTNFVPCELDVWIISALSSSFSPGCYS